MGAAQLLPTEPAACCLCGPGPLRPVAVGADFEYHTSGDAWRMARCLCGLLVLDPRPTADQFDRIYPPGYHAFAFTPERFGLAHRVRRRLEAVRLLRAFAGLPARARILDVGCGDGFHLGLLREFGRPGWELLGVDPSERATRRATAAGLPVWAGTVETLPAAAGRFDAALMVMTVEHLADPLATLQAVRGRLAPGGRLVVVTDNAGSPDARLFGRRHWGGYHFPRHTYLFDRRSVRQLGERAGFRVRQVRTLVSPVNWVYSVRNVVVDAAGPRWLTDRLSLSAAPALGAGTVLDFVCQLVGHGAVLQAVFVVP